MCGKKKTLGHHFSYMPDDMLSVIWLCASHHKKIHRIMKPVFPSGKCVRSFLKEEKNKLKAVEEKMREFDKRVFDEFTRNGGMIKATARKFGVRSEYVNNAVARCREG